jgi:hypothetical protein
MWLSERFDSLKQQANVFERRPRSAASHRQLRSFAMPWSRNCPAKGKNGAEDRLAASIEQVRQGMVPLDRAQQALFALVDSLAKILLTCIPEPDGHALAAAVARAQGRHARLLKSAGQAMGDDSRLAMQELVKHGER